MFSTIYLIYGFLLILPTLANLLMNSDGEVVLVGSTVRLNCSLVALNQSSYTPLNITWYHNETSLVGVRSPILDATSSVLELQDVQFDDSGAYTCSLIEARASARMDISVGLSPQPATALKCSSNNFDNANCTWNRGGQHSNLPTVDVVERRRDGDSEWKVCTENIKGVSSMPSACNQTTCYVICRRQGMGASYRVKTTNLLGEHYSKEVHFNIDVETIPNPPLDVMVKNESASSLLVTWKPDPGVDTGGKKNLVKYFVKYRWEGEEDWSEIKVEERYGKRNAVLLTGLSNPYGLYFVKVKCSAMDQRSQFGQFSKVASGRTSEIAPVDAPGNFSCHSEVLERTGKRNIHLSWELVPNKFKRNGEITDQIIRVRQMVHMKDSADIWIVGPNETSYTLKDMELEEKYEISIRVRNSVSKSGNYSLCSVQMIQTGDLSSVYLAVVCASSIFVIAAFFWMGFKCYKKVMKGFPDFPLPSHLGNSNLYLCTQSPHRTVTREKEVYDELLSGNTLFVDLPMSEKTPLDSPGVSPGPNGDVAFSGTFDVGITPQQAVASFPVANDDELNLPFSSPSHGDAHRQRHWSSETCTSSLNSPISVGSGGSYFVLRESDSTSYCVLAKDGFSPVKEKKQDQDLRVAGSSAVGLTPSCLDSDNDSDGEVSILGMESKKESCKFGSPERVLYTRKHVLPTLTDPKVGQPRLLKAAIGSPIKSRDAAGVFGLDEVTEEEVESLGTIQENDDDMKGKGGGDEDEVQEAGGELGLAGSSKKVQDATGINIPSENVQSSVGDVDNGGGASAEMLGENASLCHTDQPNAILNYITVCKDDEGDDADEEVKTGTGEDESSLFTGSSSGTSPPECLSNHLYPGSSNGTYIDQAQLANISPVSSPTRSINHHDIKDS